MRRELLPAQKEVLFSNTKVTVFTGGIGSGKTATIQDVVLKNISKYPDSDGLLVANTYSQLINATVKQVSAFFEELGLKHKVVMNGPRKYIKVNNTTIHLYSLENPDIIRGIEVGWIAGDEMAFADRYGYDVIMGRLRCRKGPRQAFFFTSPNGFNWLYDLVQDSSEDRLTHIKARTKDNKFLPDDYYPDLVFTYGGEDTKMARQELFGEFVNLNHGAVYYNFDREVNTGNQEHPHHRPYYVGMDFNVDEMNAVICRVTKDTIYVEDHIRLTQGSANTFDLADEVARRYAGKNLKIIPDSTGNKLTSNAQKTDIQILQQAGLQVERTRNPRIKDRQNTVNYLLKKKKIVINPKCKHLIKEMERLTHEEKENKVAHCSVALGYVAWKFFPLRKSKQSEVIDY